MVITLPEISTALLSFASVFVESIVGDVLCEMLIDPSPLSTTVTPANVGFVSTSLILTSEQPLVEHSSQQGYQNIRRLRCM